MRRAGALILWSFCIVLVLLIADQALAVERFPPPDFIETGHQLPVLDQRPLRMPGWMEYVHVAALALGLVLAAVFVLKLRSRTAIRWLSIGSLAYFGFYLGGCVCPVAAIQNVTLGLFSDSYTLPITVVLLFALPLIFALLFGRVFCSGVCALGAIQDLVLIRAVRVPLWLQYPLGFVPFVYLGLAVLMAATDSAFLICRYDPFAPIFRLDGRLSIVLFGGAVLLLSTFIGRPFCRFLCPYGALLGLCSRVAWRRVTITPDDCINCRLCRKACPFGAIRPATVEGEAGL